MYGFGSQWLVATELKIHRVSQKTSMPNFISHMEMITSTTLFASFYLVLVLFLAFSEDESVS